MQQYKNNIIGAVLCCILLLMVLSGCGSAEKSIKKGVPHFQLPKDQLGQPAVDLFTRDDVKIFNSKGEMRKLVQGGGVSLNKEKLGAFDQVVTADDLIDGKYLLVQRGKKNYYLITGK